MQGVKVKPLVLEIGGGPTLYTVAALIPYSDEVHFCDYVPENLAEIRLWLDNKPEAFDWYPYIEMVLEEEGKPVSSQTVAQRATEIRRKVTCLTSCNILENAPLGQTTNQYDLVVSNYCTDVVASTVQEWRQIMYNISTLVKPGGGLVISVLNGTDFYSCGPKKFPNLILTDEDIYNGYMVAGYDPKTFRLDKMAMPYEREYTGLTSAIAYKTTW
jgi:SAM-dependent methyltransferase